MSDTLRNLIRDIPDFPKPGIVFKDITPLLASPQGLSGALEMMGSAYPRGSYDMVVGIESRGFFFAPAIARDAGVGFVPVRKKGKLPHRTIVETYDTEYSKDHIEMHEDALLKGHRVLIVDDVLATGGTARAVCNLVEKTGAHVAGTLFLIELSFLNGRKPLAGYQVRSLITY